MKGFIPRNAQIASGLLAVFACLLAGVSIGQSYPVKPVRFIIPLGPGTGSDTLGRVISQRLSEQLGQGVVADNRSGASGSIGSEIAAKSAPDGYTVILGTNATMITFPALSSSAKYRLERDFVAVSSIARTPMLLVTSSLPASPKSVAELVSLVRAKPVSFATNGAGTMGHLATEVFLSKAGLKATQVAYKGSGQSLTDVIRGEIMFMTDTPAAALTFVRSGRLRALAVTGSNRLPSIPEVPTFEEEGISGLRQLYAWWGLFAPVGVPQPILQKLRDETSKAVMAPETKTRLQFLELEPFVLPSEKFTEFMHSEVQFWGEFVRQTGLKLD